MTYTVLQCDGTKKVYESAPWWAKEKPELQRYRLPSSKITKADKISAAMADIRRIRYGR